MFLFGLLILIALCLLCLFCSKCIACINEDQETFQQATEQNHRVILQSESSSSVLHEPQTLRVILPSEPSGDLPPTYDEAIRM